MVFGVGKGVLFREVSSLKSGKSVLFREVSSVQECPHTERFDCSIYNQDSTVMMMSITVLYRSSRREQFG